MKEEQEGLAALERKLDTIIRLLALGVVADTQGGLKERAVRLNRAGMSPKEIATLLDTTPNTAGRPRLTARFRIRRLADLAAAEPRSQYSHAKHRARKRRSR